MQVELTPQQRDYIRQAIDRVRIEREEDAVSEALALWAERARKRIEILDAVARADRSQGRGEGRLVTTAEQASELACNVEQRGTARRQQTHIVRGRRDIGSLLTDE